MHCNGVIGFGNVSGGGGGGGPLPAFFVGNITTNGSVRSDFLQYWDQITPENEGKWGIGRSDAGRVQLERPRPGVQLRDAEQHPVQAAHVHLGRSVAELDQLAERVRTGRGDRGVDSRLLCALPEYGDDRRGQRGHVRATQPAAYAQNAFGNNWIIRSFQLARQYCPNAVLILNDYNVLSWDTDAFIQLATPVVNAGVVDALGRAGHGLEGWSLTDIQTRLNRVAALGLPIYITEYDVARTNDQEQLNIMQHAVPAVLQPSVRGGHHALGIRGRLHLGEWQRVDPEQWHAASRDDLADELPGALRPSFT